VNVAPTGSENGIVTVAVYQFSLGPLEQTIGAFTETGAASAVAPTSKNTNKPLVITFNIKMAARRGHVLAKPATRPSVSMAGSNRIWREELVACHPSERQAARMRPADEERFFRLASHVS
jgi:hypothetical protein